jgi:type II secretory pathway pseudopilin PulG
LVEVLTAVSIVAFVAAVSLPVVRQAKDQSRVGASVQRLKQWHAANTLYCQEAGCDRRLVLEVPCSLTNAGLYYRLPMEMYRTGGSSWTGRPNEDVYTYVPSCDWNNPYSLRDWLERIELAQGNPPYVLDETQNPGAGSALDFFKTRRVIGLRYDGSVQTRWARGILSRPEIFDAGRSSGAGGGD